MIVIPKNSAIIKNPFLYENILLGMEEATDEEIENAAMARIEYGESFFCPTDS